MTLEEALALIEEQKNTINDLQTQCNNKDATISELTTENKTLKDNELSYQQRISKLMSVNRELSITGGTQVDADKELADKVSKLINRK